MDPIIEIDGCLIGEGKPAYTIAEIGSNFDGDLSRAKKLIDAAKKCGADAVKFQSFQTDKIISKKGFEGLKKGFQAQWKKPVYEVYKAAEFPRKWHETLFNYCSKKNITFLSAPYDFEAVDLLDSLGVSAFKIGSGDITWLEFLQYVSQKQKPIILGTGASTIHEIREAVDVIRSTGNDQIILLQCVTNYPSSFENANICFMRVMREQFQCLTGLSDHTPGFIVPLGVVALGGCVIEKHFTDDKTRVGPDHPFAMDIDDFRTMVTNIRILERALGSEKKVYNEEEETRILQRRCLRAAHDISKGTVINREMIDVLRPAPKDSLLPKYMDDLVGKKLEKDIKKGEYFPQSLVK